MNKKKSVVCIIPSLSTGGAEKMALDLVTYLDKNLFRVTLISLYECKENIYDSLAKERDLAVIYLNKKPGFDTKTLLQLFKLLSELKPDIVHTHLYSSIYVAPWLTVNNNVRWVHTIHNEALKELPKIYRKIMKIFYKINRTIPIAISNIIKKTISESYNLDEEKIPLIPNGIDTEYFTPSKQIYMNPVVFVCVARFNSQKNHKLLIEAFNLALKEYSNMELLLVGDGILRKEIENQINSYEIGDSVELVGNTKDVLNILQKSDVFVLSSDYEGLPLSVLEAMSVGLPVVSTEVGGIPDIITNMEQGILVPVGNANSLAKGITLVAKNRELRDKMKVNARKQSREYDVRKMARQYEEIYKIRA